MSLKLIVGLGNPGKKFDRTRHNAGFRVAEALLEELKPVRKRKLYYGYNDQKAQAALSILSDDQLALIKSKQNQGGVK